MPDLPFTDTKPQGAADFYFGINATFRHIEQTFGADALREYWTGLGRDYQAPVWTRWADGGMAAVAQYWRDFWAAEPGADVEVDEAQQQVALDVRTCPAIAHLRAHQREILPDFCQHCFFKGDAAAHQANLEVRVAGGNGTCRQVFTVRGTAAPQDLDDIASCAVPAPGARPVAYAGASAPQGPNSATDDILHASGGI